MGFKYFHSSGIPEISFHQNFQPEVATLTQAVPYIRPSAYHYLYLSQPGEGALPEWMWNGDHINTTSLAEFLQRPLLKKLYDELNVLPQKCHTYCWKNICSGGYSINRFSKKNNFNNPTVYCEDLRMFYSQLTAFLLKQNFSRSNIEEILCHAE